MSALGGTVATLVEADADDDADATDDAEDAGEDDVAATRVHVVDDSPPHPTITTPTTHTTKVRFTRRS